MTDTSALSQLSALESEIRETLQRLQNKRESARRKSRTTFVVQLALVASATLALGLLLPAWESLLRNAALVLNTAATFVGGIAAYFNFRDRWIEHTKTVGELRGLLGEIDLQRSTLESGTTLAPAVALLDRRFREVMGSSMSQWAEIKYSAAAAEPKAK